MAAKMSGTELVGRVVTLEAFIIVLLEAFIDRPDVSDEKASAMIAAMRESTKRLAAQLGHPEAEKESHVATDELIAILLANMPSMKGETGLAK